MEKMIPLNGRIAIVDDEEKQAMPLMRVFSRLNIPYTYYKGNDYRFLPEVPENDIRILFLDLNLLGNKEESTRDIRSVLIPTISRIISPNNYPYLLILWSRQESQYKKTLEEIFQNELKSCAPIAIKNYVKSDFFHDYGTEEDNTQDDMLIIDELKRVLAEIPAYRYLILWENLTHASTDELFKSIFPNAEQVEWEKVTNVVLNSLGRAYAGQYFSEASPEEKIKASLFALNSVLVDFLDNSLAACTISSPKELDEKTLNADVINGIRADLNHKMLVFSNPNNICEPGVVVQYKNAESNYFDLLLHKIISVLSIKLRIQHETPDILDSVLKKEISNRIKQIKKDLQQTWIKIGIVVTPSCDYAQKKKVYDRIVQGVMIESHYLDYINQGDAFYISPTIKYNDRNYVIILNFNYFVTSDLSTENCGMLFKLRHPVLAEIQSKLARHINRQGIMNL